MAEIQQLKKKLKSICATQKLSQAMKTVSAVKFSQLNTRFRGYAPYAEKYKVLYRDYLPKTGSFTGKANPAAPRGFLILGSNRGLCGSFNNDILTFAAETIGEGAEGVYIITAGEQITAMFPTAVRTPDETFDYPDVPSFEDGVRLYERICALETEGKISGLSVIYPRFVNTMKQTPVCEVITQTAEEKKPKEEVFWFPDERTIAPDLVLGCYKSMVYEILLESALGAQAATLFTMRSAYDTACEYREMLEGEIQRERQTEVTSDVIETSSERGHKGDKRNG